MKKTILTGLIAAGMAASAFAASTTVTFVAEDGTSTVVVLNEDGTSLVNDVEGTYTFDEATKTLCGTSGDAPELCVTFEELGDEVGFETGFTSTSGNTGTATITAVTE